MRTFLAWLGIALLGLVLGIGGAVLSIRSSGMGSEVQIGPWTTGRNVGTADADMRTRAIVALRGLLALPASEARYFTARVDSDGRPLRGECTYAVTGTKPNGRWWSVTLYDQQGWLVPTADRAHSAGSAQFANSVDGFRVVVAPEPVRAGQIATGTRGPIELTLRVYRPEGSFAGTPLSDELPRILFGGCAS